MSFACHADDARLQIEAVGVVLLKDSSANKGGVTSSSLEVLAALAMRDDEYQLHMCTGGKAPAHPLLDAISAVTAAASHTEPAAAPALSAPGGQPVVQSLSAPSISTSGADASVAQVAASAPGAPPFYCRYVAEVQRAIVDNATAEFECLWGEKGKVGASGRLTLLSDQLSTKIVSLSRRIAESDSLWEDVELRLAVLEGGLPKTLVDLLTLPELLQVRMHTRLR